MNRRPSEGRGPVEWFLKPIVWCGSSLDDLRAVPEAARGEPVDWKPMTSIGPGAIELRLHGATELGVVVVTPFADAICVLHVFQKKSLKTSRLDIELARLRYRRLMRERLG